MKGIIDINGHLFIERGGKMKAQLCRYKSGNFCCGDWCPLFGSNYDNIYTEDIFLGHCAAGGYLRFASLEDKRSKTFG